MKNKTLFVTLMIASLAFAIIEILLIIDMDAKAGSPLPQIINNIRDGAIIIIFNAVLLLFINRLLAFLTRKAYILIYYVIMISLLTGGAYEIIRIFDIPKFGDLIELRAIEYITHHFILILILAINILCLGKDSHIENNNAKGQ